MITTGITLIIAGFTLGGIAPRIRSFRWYLALGLMVAGDAIIMYHYFQK